jgi:uncharacterized damage-inducible protein DinB
MIGPEQLRDLYRHMEWADATVWTAVLARPDTASDKKILAVLHHLHMTQHAFLRVWRGEPRNAPYPEFTEAPPMMEWGREWFPEAFSYLGTVTGESLSGPITVPWASLAGRKIGRPPADTTLGDTMLQVAMHSQYHRGQVNARLREVGGEPPIADYIAWIWLGKPAAKWPPAP